MNRNQTTNSEIVPTYKQGGAIVGTRTTTITESIQPIYPVAVGTGGSTRDPLPVVPLVLIGGTILGILGAMLLMPNETQELKDQNSLMQAKQKACIELLKTP